MAVELAIEATEVYGPTVLELAADLATQWGDKVYAMGNWLLSDPNPAEQAGHSAGQNPGNNNAVVLMIRISKGRYRNNCYAIHCPLKYNDPSGYYSDDEIMQNYNCQNWQCVEALFQEGGAYEGLWGWLYTLQQATDGDSVSSTMMVAQGNGSSINYSLTGTFQRASNGQINVHATGYTDSSGVRGIDASLSENGFAHFAAAGAYGIYALSGQNASFAVGRDAQHNYVSVDPLTAFKAGATAGPLIVKAAPAAGPLAPYVAAAGEIYTALGWGTKIGDDYIVPLIRGEWKAFGTNLLSDGVGFGLSGYGGGPGEGLAVGLDAYGLSSGVCYGTGCR